MPTESRSKQLARAVFEATTAGDATRLRELFASGADPNALQPDDDDPDHDPDDSDEHGIEARIVAHAVHGDDPDILQVFLDAGVDTAGLLSIAMQRFTDPTPFITALAAAGVDLDQPGSDGVPPLLAAAAAPWVASAAIQALLDAGARIDAVGPRGRTALHVAVGNAAGHLEAATLLVERGIDVDATDASGATALARCKELQARDGLGRHGEILELLQGAGARTGTGAAGRDRLLDLLRALHVDAPELPGSLSEAARLGDLQQVRAFLADGQHPDEPHRDGFYPIEVAAGAGHHAVVELLQAEGAEPREMTVDPHGEAKRARYRQLREELAAESPSLHAPAEAPQDRDERERTAEALLRGGALGSATDDFRVGSQPLLSFAAEQGLGRIVAAALELGLAADGPDDPQQRPPLVLAARNGHVEVCRALLAAGADPSLTHDPRGAPITYAAASGNLELVEALVEAGANLEFVGAGDQTPINQAAGPQRNAIRQALRHHRRDGLAQAKVPAVRYKRRKKMYEPSERVGTAEYEGYAPSAWPRWAIRSDIDAVCDALQAAADPRAVELELGRAPLLGAHRFSIVFQLQGSPWTLISEQGVIPRVAREHLATAAKHTEAAACWYAHHRLRGLSIEVQEPGGDHLRPLDPNEAAAWVSAAGLWIPPHQIEGDGPSDPGWHDSLVLHGLRAEHLASARRIVWRW